jgi:hypothetical protein
MDPLQAAQDNFHDTFLDFDHVVKSFPGSTVTAAESGRVPQPPFTLAFTPNPKAGAAEFASVVVHETASPNRGPYARAAHKTNTVPFTPTQVCARRCICTTSRAQR